MPAERGFERELESRKDLDSIVSSFLEELDTLSAELQSNTIVPDSRTPIVEARPPETATSAVKPALIRRRTGLITLIALAALSLVSAARIYFYRTAANSVPRQAAPAISQQPATPLPGRLNDTALLLAGLPLKSGSPMYKLSLTAPFLRHQREMQLFWARIRSGNLAAIHRWEEENVPAGLKRNPVLYPLSGADYLNAYAFFPNAPEFLLLALEAPGEIPDLNNLSSQELDQTLTAIRASVRTIATVNYLQSRSMREELTNSSFGGVVPLLLLFAAGFGHTIRDVHPVVIGPDGRLAADTEEYAPKRFRRVAGVSVPEDQVRGVQIRFSESAEGTQKSITYLQLELRDEIFSQGRAEGKFLSGLKHCNSILKSAVYLLHGSGYSRVRDFILGGSDLVIQDDSGIPYHFFLRSEWEENLFGKYTRPQPFGTLRNPPPQPLLAQRYGTGSRPIAFPYGYGALWDTGQSNLMLFVKRK